MNSFKTSIVLPDTYDSSLEGKKILKFWHKNHTAETIINAPRSEKLSFHSGPVFPTGFPHSGHILNGIVKDALSRYGRQRNLQVDSKFGWDSHGIAIEHEVDKKLGIKSLEEVKNIKHYNEECRRFVERNASEWANVFERCGNWVDFSRGYSTMNKEYMERVWSVFKQLFDKGLVYKDTKVLPYSTGCATYLSNFEAEQNCKEVCEVGMTVSINIVYSDEKLLVWTTAPGSLMANSAVCVNPKATYVKVRMHRNGKKGVYILSKTSLQRLFKKRSEYTILEEMPGGSLKNLRYEPLGESIVFEKKLRVFMANSVADGCGNGIVPLDDVVESLKERGQVFSVEEVKYKKPYCWRSDTPLVKKQVESWFIRVEALSQKLLKNASKVRWHPDEAVGEHFKKWLNDKCTDWAVSRTRNWGTPIPVWSSPSGDEVVCVGSINELEHLTGKINITDLHREVVDWLVIPSRTEGNPPLRRIPEVFDCWFESGAMPFTLPAKSFRADLVAEGFDQIHGWFYTTLVLSTALGKPPPFRNVFASGMVQESGGTKVSKRKHNNHEPMRLIEKYGADSVRLYLLSCPVNQSQGITIREEGVVHVAQKVIEPLFRIFHFMTTNFCRETYGNNGFCTEWYSLDHCPIDHWILSCTESLLKFYEQEMKAYRLHTIVPRIIILIEQVEDWYMPMKSPNGVPADHSDIAYLFDVIYKLCLVMAPFAPFITEYIYQYHKPYLVFWRRAKSIHDVLLLPADEAVISQDIESRYARMQAIVRLVRELRDLHMVPIEYPIAEIVVVHQSDGYLRDIELTKALIQKLVNANDVRTSSDRHQIGAQLKAGLKISSSVDEQVRIASALGNLSDEDVHILIQEDPVRILDKNIPLEDIEISYQISKEQTANFAVLTNGDLAVGIKMNKDLTYYEEGAVKVIENRLRSLKKKANYYPTDRAIVYYSTNAECLHTIVRKHGEKLQKTTNCDLKPDSEATVKEAKVKRIEEVVSVKGLLMNVLLYLKLE